MHRTNEQWMTIKLFGPLNKCAGSTLVCNCRQLQVECYFKMFEQGLYRCSMSECVCYRWTYLLICVIINWHVCLQASTHDRRTFRTFSRNSGQSFDWPMWMSKSLNKATWLLISTMSWNEKSRTNEVNKLFCEYLQGNVWFLLERLINNFSVKIAAAFDLVLVIIIKLLT